MTQVVESLPRVAIVGLGPVGQILALHLQRAGVDLVACDIDKARMHLIQRDGIRLLGAIEGHVPFDHTERLCTTVRQMLDHKPGMIVFAVKAYQLGSVIQSIKEYQLEHPDALPSPMAYVSAQNGIDVELELAEAFGESQTFRMVINFAGNQRAPNVTHVSFFNPPNYVASIDDSQPALARTWAQMLSAVKLETLAVDSFEILRRIWEKTILNSSISALCGVAQMNMKEVMAMPDTADIIEQVIMESIAVARAENIHFEANFVRHCMRYLRKSGSHFPSLAVDLLHKRPTEIDYFNGKFVEYGKKHYIPTPMHLAFANMVKAMTQKALGKRQPVPAKPAEQGSKRTISSSQLSGAYYLGVDLGAGYTKIVVVNSQQDVLYQDVLKTLVRDKMQLEHLLETVRDRFPIDATCASGYGREQFAGADLTKTEIHCAAKAVHQHQPRACNVIDIGAEDIKVITIDADGAVTNFYMNSKCASGTGAFLSEMAEKIDIDIQEMSKLASMSSTSNELNSFCTVFAKTEVMKWHFDQVPIEDIARSIYLSLTQRIHKLKIDRDLPIVLAGGVIAYHPFVASLLSEKFHTQVSVLPNPRYCVAYGAALHAARLAQRRSETGLHAPQPTSAIVHPQPLSEVVVLNT